MTNTKFELAYTKAVSKLLKYFKGSNDKASGDLSGLTGLSAVCNHTISNAVGQTACGRAVGGQHALLQSSAAACIPAIPPHHSFVLLNIQGENFDVTTPTLAGEELAATNRQVAMPYLAALLQSAFVVPHSLHSSSPST